MARSQIAQSSAGTGGPLFAASATGFGGPASTWRQTARPVAPLVRRTPSEQVIEDRPERVDVALGAVQIALPARLLGRHVRGRPEHVAVPSDVRARQRDVVFHGGLADLRIAVRDAPSQAPVHHQDLAELADHEVLGLEVAMDDPAAVGVADGLADARERVHEPAKRPPRRRLAEPFGARRRVDLGDDLAEGATAHLLHREPEAPVGELAAIVDGDDPGCWSSAVSWASAKKRARIEVDSTNSQRSTFIASTRPNRVSRMRRTSPEAPPAIRPRSS